MNQRTLVRPTPADGLTRREVLAGVGAGACMLALPACTTLSASHPETAASTELDRIAWNLLAHEPERATSLGVDTDSHAALRSRIKDVSPAGLDAYAATLRTDLARARAFDTSGLDAATRTSF